MADGISAARRRERTTPSTDWARVASTIDLTHQPRRAQAVGRLPAKSARRQARRTIVGGRIKRGFDIVASLAAIVLLLPLIALVALAVKAWDRGPALYRHRRIGLDGSAFDCIKFRTMAVDADAALQRHLAADREARREWEQTQKLKCDPRVTPLGASLRKTSVDELPQLFNVLKGEMSLVGPRPIVASEMPKYGDSIDHYLRARPGLTGLWQVSGRNDVDYATRVAFDRDYVENWSFRRDLLIIASTARVVLTGRGGY